MEYECPFSETEFINPAKDSNENIVVECPECGSIRTVKMPKDGRPIYPRHKTLDGSTRIRPRWKQVKGAWQWTEGE